MYHEDGCNYCFFSTIDNSPSMNLKKQQITGFRSWICFSTNGWKIHKKSSLKLSFLINSILLIPNAFRLIWQFHNLRFFGGILSYWKLHRWWRLMVMAMDTFSPKVNLYPSWMCLMANTLGIPGSRRRFPHFIFGLDLRLPEEQKTSGNNWQVWRFETMEATGVFFVLEICCFQDDIIFIKYHPSLASWTASFFVDLRWGMPSSASVLLQCQTLVPLPSELLASWRRRHQTRWWGKTPT